MPAASSAAIASAVSSSAIGSGSVTHVTTVRARSRSRPESASPSRSRPAMNASASSRRYEPRRALTTARWCDWRESRTSATRPSSTGEASSRRVWPVGAVSTTTCSKPSPSRIASTRPITSSIPGSDSLSSRPTSSSSRYVPRSAIVDSISRRGASQRSNADAESTLAAKSPLAPRTGDGEAPTRVPSTAGSEDAGSVVTSRVRARGAPSTESMAAQVVLPTPPLPPTKCHLAPSAVEGLMFVAFEGRLDAGDLHLLRRDDRGLAAALAFLDLADAGDDVGLDLVELLLTDLLQLEAHLRVEQALAQHAVVVQLGIDGGRDLVEHEADAGEDQAVDDQHGVNAECRMPNAEAASLNGRVRASGGC